MGIPSYFSHIVRKHRNIIKSFKVSDNPKINNLYLDCNSFIYEAFNSINGTLKIKDKHDKNVVLLEDKIITYVCDSLIKYIHLLNPDRRLFIAFDGVAPMAKLNQQRNRRYMTAYQAKLNDSYKWNTSAITPGTEFMKKLGVAVSKTFFDPKKYGLETIIVSASDECGEGEHKIYDYIRNHAAYHKDTYTVIYGLDADLIMLTLNHLHISENMYLFRETPEFIKNLDKTLNPNETYFLDIPLFAKTIINELSANDKSLEDISLEDISLKNDVLFDYIFMCFFLGNDFLPHFPALNIRTNGINRLIDAYKYVFGNNGDTLTHNREIIWKNVRKYVDYLAQNEYIFIKEEYKYRDNLSKRTMFDEKSKQANNVDFDDTLLLPLHERSVEIYINPNESGWMTRYYKSLFNKRIDDEQRRLISTNYLEGLEWTMKYYSTGCADWRWVYNYYYPPLLVDLIKYVPYNSHTFVPLKPTNPVSPLTQLSYVLPPSSMDLLPLEIRTKLLKEKPDWYLGNYNFIWAFCKFFWESHVDLPKIDINQLEEIINK